MIELTSGRSWEYAYKEQLEYQLASFRDQLEGTGDSSHNYLRGVIHGIRLAIKEMSLARAKHNQDGDADFEE